MSDESHVQLVHEPDNIFITSQGTKRHHVFQQAYYPHTTYLYDSNQDLVDTSSSNITVDLVYSDLLQ